MPMEQVFRHCDKDTLKLAMLKHEETFRQQVNELHRLYRIQKLLMRDLKRELKSQSNLSTSPNGGFTEHGRGALGMMCAYEHRYAARGPGGYVAVATPAPRTALSLDVVAPAVEYVRSAEEEDDDEAEEETDDDAELELTLAVGGGGAKKRYGEYPSGGESLSSSSTESDVLTAAASAGREWRQARGTPFRKRRPAAGGLDVVQVEDGVGMQAPPPLLFHWLSLKMA